MLRHRAYAAILLSVFLCLAGGTELWRRAQQYSCWAGGYGQDAWLAYCNSERYGVYDVEAIWHGVEPDVAPDLARAQVVTLGDSRLQSALSLGRASEWFAQRRIPIYMLGVPTAESAFGERLIEHFHLHPKVLVLDASPYFTGDLGAFEHVIFEQPQRSLAQVQDLHEFEETHRLFCQRFTWACGHTFAYFRSRTDGHWIFPAPTPDIWVGRRDVPNDELRIPTGEIANESRDNYPKYLAAARRLVQGTGMDPRCIVITHVPSDEDLRDLARYLGSGLGTTVVEPDVEDLFTFDRAHLTPQSSLRWTRRFLEELEPVLQRCGAAGPGPRPEA